MKATFTTHIDLSADIRDRAIAILTQQLADTSDLYSQTKQAHWNVKGMHFIQLHELFHKLADQVEDAVDLIAERVTALGGVALGTIRMASAASRLPEYPVDAIDGRPHVEALTERYAALAKSTRAAIDTAAGFGMPIRPTCSLKSRAKSTRVSGSSKPTSRADRRRQTNNPDPLTQENYAST